MPEINGKVEAVKESHIELSCDISEAVNSKDEVILRVAIDLTKANPNETGKGHPETYLRIAIFPVKNSSWFSRKNGANADHADTLMRMIRQYLTLTDESALLKVNAAVTKSTRETPPA